MTETAKEYACILAFDVKIERDAAELAEDLDVRIFHADIIYHLLTAFTSYLREVEEERRKALAPTVIFPCILRIVPGCIFNKRTPIVIGVEVVEGQLRVGTPICVITKNNPTADGGEAPSSSLSLNVCTLGRVTSIEHNHKPLQVVRKGHPGVAIKLEPAGQHEASRMYGRHFTDSDVLMSKLTRTSIDALKEGFRDEVTKEEWALVVRLKKSLGIQ